MTKGKLDKLIRQSNSKYAAVRERVAGNPSCPIDWLDRLSRDEDWNVREGVAQNPNCPIEVLVGLIGGPYSDVREAAIQAFSRRKETATPEERDFIKDYEALVKLGLI